MKKYKISLFLSVFTLVISSLHAQNVNWASLTKENRHILNANIGLEHGVIYGIGYGYQIKSGLFPIIANIEYSFPSGSIILDDFKTQIGGQIRWLEYHDFQFSTRLHGVFRRYENDFARLVNFGSDMSGLVGYYRPKWFVAGEVGFDKAIVTHFRHSDIYKEQYSDVVDGWYEPSTGGNFYYGFQAGLSFRRQDITLRAGKMLTQDFNTTPLLPTYGQLGYTMRF